MGAFPLKKHGSATVTLKLLLTNFASQKCQHHADALCIKFGGAGGTEGSSALCHTM